MLIYAAPIIFLILLWIRPEYMFLIFYVVANWLLAFLLLDVWTLTWADAPTYAVAVAIGLAVNFAVGALFVALFKWVKSRKSGAEKRADKLVEEARAEARARGESQ